jgi:hypothetical protein
MNRGLLGLATEPPDEAFAIAPDEVALALLADAERSDAPHAVQANSRHATPATPLIRLEDRGPAPTARVWQTIAVAQLDFAQSREFGGRDPHNRVRPRAGPRRATELATQSSRGSGVAALL